MKRIRRAPAPIALAVLAAAGAAALVIAFAAPRPFVVGFFDVDADLAAGMKAEIDAWGASSRTKVEYRDLGSGVPDAKNLRGLDAAFLYPSTLNKGSADLFDAVPREAGDLVALPLRKSGAAGGRDWAMPLLIDSWEIAWRSDLFAAGALSGRTRPEELARRMASIPKKSFAPFIAAGGDDADLVDLAGILVADRIGPNGYGRLAELAGGLGFAGVQESGDADALLEMDLGGASLADCLEPLVRLGDLGFAHRNWLGFKEADLIAAAESGLASLSVQKLSTRRSMRREALAPWRSAPIAARRADGLPAVTAAVVSMARPKASRRADDYEALCLRLASTGGQRVLQQKTGLAPAAAAASAIDIQASEARSAASGAAVLQGLSRDAFASESRLKDFAAAIRAFLERNRR